MSPGRRTVLYLDTTGSELMLGLSAGSALTSQQMRIERKLHSDSQRYHSAMIIPLIQDALAQAELSINQLTDVAVNIGPGSFTGIRTGLITVRTMGQFMPITVHAFTSFELLASLYPGEPVSIYLDARRGRSYFTQLRYNEQGHYATHQPPQLVVLSEHTPDLSGPIVASESLYPLLNAESPHALEAIRAAHSSPARMSALLQASPIGFTQPWHLLEPLYLEAPNITLSKKSIGSHKT